MHRIKSIGIVSFAQVLGVIGVLSGLVFGVLYGGIVALVGVASIADQNVEGVPALLLAGILLVGFPIGSGIFHFVIGLVYGLVLNLVFKISGGLEIELERQR